MGVKKGDIAFAHNTENDKSSFAIFADVARSDRIGEGSLNLVQQGLGLPIIWNKTNTKIKGGGTETNSIQFFIFPGSGNGKPLTNEEINTIGQTYIKILQE